MERPTNQPTNRDISRPHDTYISTPDVHVIPLNNKNYFVCLIDDGVGTILGLVEENVE